MPDDKKRHVQRKPQREVVDKSDIYKILDEGKVAHIGLIDADEPVVVPMGYVRDGDSILLHGSTGTRLFLKLKEAPTICATVTLLDDIIVARSAFNSSMNYRSVMAFGIPKILEGKVKKLALNKITDGLVPGFSKVARPMTNKEIAQTMIVRLELDQASAKQRTGGASDDPEDIELNAWAGRLPLKKGFDMPITNDDSKVREIPEWIHKIVEDAK